MLASRELQVIHGCALGLTNDQIGARLGIAHGTVKAHLQHATDKTGVKCRAGLVGFAFRQGWLVWVDDELVIAS